MLKQNNISKHEALCDPGHVTFKTSTNQFLSFIFPWCLTAQVIMLTRCTILSHQNLKPRQTLKLSLDVPNLVEQDSIDVGQPKLNKVGKKLHHKVHKHYSLVDVTCYNPFTVCTCKHNETSLLKPVIFTLLHHLQKAVCTLCSTCKMVQCKTQMKHVKLNVLCTFEIYLRDGEKVISQHWRPRTQ